MSFKALLHRLNRKDQPIFCLHPFFKNSLFFLLFVSVVFGGTKIFAQANYLKQKQDAMGNGTSAESWLGEAMGSNMLSLINAISGPLPESVTNTQYEIKEGDDTSYKPGGAIGISTNLMASIYANPPASGIQYLAEIKDNLFGKPAYAQTTGIGFQGLKPILPLWRAMRNVIYTISSLFFVIIGIMIMLRVKISQQAVITIQSAIPKMITTLILVTFSYAIAGLLIDMMNFVQAVGIALLFQIRGIGFMENLIPGDNSFFQLNQAGFLRHMNLISRLIFNKGNSFLLTTGSILGGVFLTTTSAITGASIAGLTVLGTWGLWGIGIFMVIGILLVLLILVVFILYQLMVTMFGLFKCYVTILMQIIFAPIIIGIGAFPNSKTGFESWLKQMLANLTVFPAVYLFLIFVNVLLYYIDNPLTIASTGIKTVMAAESFSNMWAPNVIFFAGPVSIRFAICIASFLIVSKIPVLIPQTVFGIKPSPWGQGMEQSLASLQKSPLAGGFVGNLRKKYDKYSEQAYQRRIDERNAEFENMGIPLTNARVLAEKEYRSTDMFGNILGAGRNVSWKATGKDIKAKWKEAGRGHGKANEMSVKVVQTPQTDIDQIKADYKANK